MERLTHERTSGIKAGYWSPDRKEELVQRLGAYEATGLEPEQLREMDRLYLEKCREVAELGKRLGWIPVAERLPENDNYILVSFSNFTFPDIARYETDDAGGAFYPGDEEESYTSLDLFVNAWMPLPEPWKG